MLEFHDPAIKLGFTEDQYRHLMDVAEDLHLSTAPDARIPLDQPDLAKLHLQHLWGENYEANLGKILTFVTKTHPEIGGMLDRTRLGNSVPVLEMILLAADGLHKLAPDAARAALAEANAKLVAGDRTQLARTRFLMRLAAGTDGARPAEEALFPDPRHAAKRSRVTGGEAPSTDSNVEAKIAPLMAEMLAEPNRDKRARINERILALRRG